jgi:RNA-binding protein
MADLTSRQRAVLRSLAQSIKPVLQVGREGVTDAFVSSVEAALNNRELLKIKVLETAPVSAQEVADEMLPRIADAQFVQVIGRTLVIYRRHPEKPEIVVPAI